MKRKRESPQVEEDPRPQKKRKIDAQPISLLSSESETENSEDEIANERKSDSRKSVKMEEEDIIIVDTPTPTPMALIDNDDVFQVEEINTSNQRVPPPPPPAQQQEQNYVNDSRRKRSSEVRIYSQEGVPVVPIPVLSVSQHHKLLNLGNPNRRSTSDEIVVEIDEEVLRGKGQKKIETELRKAFPNVEVHNNNHFPSSLMFSKKSRDGVIERLSTHLIIRIPAETFVSMVMTENGIHRYIEDLEKETEADNTMIILVVCSLSGYLDTQGKKKYNNRVNKKDKFICILQEDAKSVKEKIEMDNKRVKIYYTTSTNHTAQSIVQIVGKIQDAIHEKATEKRIKQELDLNPIHPKNQKFYKASDAKEAFIMMLLQIPGVNIKQAEAIQKAYDKFENLIKRYRSEGYTIEENMDRLADIPLIGSRGKKKVGKAVSKKVYLMFTEREGNKRFNTRN